MIGVLLMNVGSPDAPDTASVRRYLRQFLMDYRIITLPAPLRFLLVNGVIAPFRAPQSAEKYRSIWWERGSPLVVLSEDLADGLRERLGDGYAVEVGMAFGNPSIPDAVERLLARGVDRVLLAPMFPQASSATTAGVNELALKALSKKWLVPDVTTLGTFFDHPSWVASTAAVLRDALDAAFPDEPPDHVVFSYHGMPVSHIARGRTEPSECLRSSACCLSLRADNRGCYRAQCYASSRALAGALGLSDDQYTTSFQSRLGNEPWLEPYTDKLLEELPKRGLRRIAIAVPSFTADCLETLEEIHMEGKEIFEEAGGREFVALPCNNVDPRWMDAVATLVREAVPA